jgi:hypothetical protein
MRSSIHPDLTTDFCRFPFGSKLYQAVGAFFGEDVLRCIDSIIELLNPDPWSSLCQTYTTIVHTLPLQQQRIAAVLKGYLKCISA